MKKVIIALVIVFAGMTSCKKEESAVPNTKTATKPVADIREHTGWD